jgi:hypothetical protein
VIYARTKKCSEIIRNRKLVLYIPLFLSVCLWRLVISSESGGPGKDVFRARCGPTERVQVTEKVSER